MRRLMLLGLAAAMVLQAGAARRVTVAELEQALAAATAEHRPDADLAHQVAAMELSERLTDATLDRFAAKLAVQPRTALALQLLADQSAFLDPPPSELPATAPPDSAAQQRMLDAARAYAMQSWTRMPNFFVTRVTTSFDDSPHVLVKGGWPVRAGLQPVGTSSRQITFRDGKEAVDQTTAKAGDPPNRTQEPGLRSWGEFGPALTVVMADMAGHKVAFSHWEQTSGELTAVYRYEVPKEASHYAVTYGFLTETLVGRTQFGYSGVQRSAQQIANIPRSTDEQGYSETPGYHGTVAIDPDTGAVLRLTIEADLSRGDPLLRAATMIGYGPVTIGDRQFICPLRGLAISSTPVTPGKCGLSSQPTNAVGDAMEWAGGTSHCGNTPILLINETRFADYHRLGSTARMILDGAVAGAPNPESPKTPAANVETSSGRSSEPPAGGARQPETGMTSSASQPVPPVEVRATPQPAEPAVPEISMNATDGVPDLPANAPPDQGTGVSFKVTSRLVDVGVVAYDKKGRPVTDLKAGDFEIYDNGHKQEVRFFNSPLYSSPSRAPDVTSGATPVAADAPSSTFSNRAPDPAAAISPSAIPEAGATILLIDESHIAWNDMNNARGHMLKFLEALAPAERVGLYTMTGLGFKVLVEATTDHAALIARLNTFTPAAQSVSQAQDEEIRNRQQINEVHNVADLNSVNGNHIDVPDAGQTVDPQLLTMGSNPARASLIILAQVARHLTELRGHKNLVWVSSDNVFADWQDQAVGIDKSPKSFHGYALRAQEAMNDAHTAVYPFDVSQLESAAITADMQHRNVELTPASSNGSGPSTGGRNMQPGRIAAEMSQDLHPIQGDILEVAAATGGRTIRRSGDLAAALTGIVEDGHATYQLSFSPQGQADDQYHAISVKLAGRRGHTLRYRTGYQFAKEPATLKDRFQQAVWRPVDVSEIAVKVEIAAASGDASVKLNIAAGDLGMEQRAGRWVDKLDIFFVQRDDAGLHSNLDGQTLGLRLKSSTYQNLLSSGVPFEHAVEMRPGMGSLRVLVVDENSGRMGSVTVPAVVLKAAP